MRPTCPEQPIHITRSLLCFVRGFRHRFALAQRFPLVLPIAAVRANGVPCGGCDLLLPTGAALSTLTRGSLQGSMNFYYLRSGPPIRSCNCTGCLLVCMCSERAV